MFQLNVQHCSQNVLLNSTLLLQRASESVLKKYKKKHSESRKGKYLEATARGPHEKPMHVGPIPKKEQQPHRLPACASGRCAAARRNATPPPPPHHPPAPHVSYTVGPTPPAPHVSKTVIPPPPPPRAARNAHASPSSQSRGLLSPHTPHELESPTINNPPENSQFDRLSRSEISQFLRHGEPPALPLRAPARRRGGPGAAWAGAGAVAARRGEAAECGVFGGERGEAGGVEEVGGLGGGGRGRGG